MILIIFFIVALVVLIILLYSKWVEERTGNKNFIGKGLSKLDGPATTLNSDVSFKWKQISQTVRYIFLIVIPHRSEESWKEAKKMAVQGYQKQKSIIMGKRDIGNGGSSASFYLKKIKEDQDNGKDGRIEEE